MANLQISKLDNYIHILDMDKNQLYQEHSFRVLVRKLTPNGTKYDISFLRPDSTPAAFYSATIGQIFDATGTPFSQGSWEVWYQNNTGDINTSSTVDVNATIREPIGPRDCGESVSTILCNKQANVPVVPGINLVVGYKDMKYFTMLATGGPGRVLYSFSIYNQDTTVSILVSTDAGSSFFPVRPGVTINYDAGGLLNVFDPESIIIYQNSATVNPLVTFTCND